MDQALITLLSPPLPATVLNKGHTTLTTGYDHDAKMAFNGTIMKKLEMIIDDFFILKILQTKWLSVPSLMRFSVRYLIIFQ